MLDSAGCRQGCILSEVGSVRTNLGSVRIRRVGIRLVSLSCSVDSAERRATFIPELPFAFRNWREMQLTDFGSRACCRRRPAGRRA